MVFNFIARTLNTSYVIIRRAQWYRHSDNCVCGYAGVRTSEPWFTSRVSNYPRLQNDTETTCRGRFSTCSLPECNYECFVAFCARRVCVYDLSRSFARRSAKPRDRRSQRDVLTYYRDRNVYAIICSLARNQKFMIGPETPFSRMRVSCVPMFNIVKIRELIR